MVVRPALDSRELAFLIRQVLIDKTPALDTGELASVLTILRVRSFQGQGANMPALGETTRRGARVAQQRRFVGPVHGRVLRSRTLVGQKQEERQVAPALSGKGSS